MGQRFQNTKIRRVKFVCEDCDRDRFVHIFWDEVSRTNEQQPLVRAYWVELLD